MSTLCKSAKRFLDVLSGLASRAFRRCRLLPKAFLCSWLCLDSFKPRARIDEQDVLGAKSSIGHEEDDDALQVMF